MQRLNYSAQESKNNINVSDTPVTLKQSQDHQTLYELNSDYNCKV